MNRKSPGRSRGISALELLIVLSGLLIVTVIVAPVAGGNQAKSDLNSAVEMLESSFTVARQTARIYRTDVVLSLQTDESERSTLSYSVPLLKQSVHLLGFQETEFQMPKGVRLMADRKEIRFNSRGFVEPPAEFVLVSSKNDDLSELVTLQ